MLIPKDTELPPSFVQNGKNFPAYKTEFPTEEQFEQNRVLHDKILMWQEVPTEVICQIESVEEISTKIESAMVDKYRTRFKAFATSYLMNELKDFGWR